MKKLLLILIPVLLLLGGGGAVVYFLYLKDELAANSEPEPPPPPPPPLLVPLESITIPVIRQGSIKKFVLLKITLQVKHQEGKELAIVAMPRIRDHSIRALHSFFASVPVDAPISIVSLKNRLRKVAAESIGTEPLVDVLIEGIYEKRGG
ncbi:MAG: hypothetical protein QNJ84_01370 [Alphaproteobacteria bacterium]|nr:hypothetical protein [Alphaproteobacteria bacterium]